VPASRRFTLATSHAREVFRGFAERAGTKVEAMLVERARAGALLKRFPTLTEVADVAAFVASDRARFLFVRRRRLSA